MLLYPDGYLSAKSAKEIERSPWFWSSKREAWICRPTWVALRGQAMIDAAKAD